MEPTLYGYSLDDFKDEARDLLDRAEGILSDIRQYPVDPDKVNALFRVIHSLKGSAAYAGLTEVDSFAHLYENLLGDLRNSRDEITDDVLGVLVRARDYLEDLVFHPSDSAVPAQDDTPANPVQQLSLLLASRREKRGANTPPVNPEKNITSSKMENIKRSGIQALSPPLGNSDLVIIPEISLSHRIVLSTDDPVKMKQNDVIRVSIRNSLKYIFEDLNKPEYDKDIIHKLLDKLEGTVLWAFGAEASDAVKYIEKMGDIISRPDAINKGPELKIEFNSLSMALKMHLSTLESPEQTVDAKAWEVEEEKEEAGTVAEEKKRVSLSDVRNASRNDIVKITCANALETLLDLLNDVRSKPSQIEKNIKRLRELNTWAFDDDKKAGIHLKFLEDLIRRPYDSSSAEEMKEHLSALKSVFAELTGEKEISSSEKAIQPAEDIKELHDTRRQKAKPAAVSSPTSTLRVKSEDLESLISTIGDLAGLDAKDYEKLQAQVLQLRMVPVGELFSRFRKIVRDISEELGKDIDIEISGESVKLDKVIADRLNEPIMHMIRNAVSHGLETPEERKRTGKTLTGLIRLNAFHEGGQIIIEASDDGKGISLKKVRERAIEMGLISSSSENVMPENALLEMIFTPGFSTAKETDRISGRGVGMDVVKDVISSLQGTVSIETKEGKGTTFRLKLPLTLAVIKAIVLEQNGNKIALPSAFVDRVISMTVEEIEAESIMDNSRLSLDLAGEGDVLPLVDMGKLLGDNKNRTRCVVLVKGGMGQKAALVVDGSLGRQPLMVKPLDRFAENRFFSSAALVDNDLILMLNTPALITV